MTYEPSIEFRKDGRMSKPRPEKYRVHQYAFERALDLHNKGVKEYETSAFDMLGDMSRNEARREFYTRLAEYCGFEIKFSIPETDA